MKFDNIVVGGAFYLSGCKGKKNGKIVQKKAGIIGREKQSRQGVGNTDLLMTKFIRPSSGWVIFISPLIEGITLSKR